MFYDFNNCGYISMRIVIKIINKTNNKMMYNRYILRITIKL